MDHNARHPNRKRPLDHPLPRTVDPIVDWAIAAAMLSFLITVMLTAIDWEVGLNATWLMIRSMAILATVSALTTLALWWNLHRNFLRR